MKTFLFSFIFLFLTQASFAKAQDAETKTLDFSNLISSSTPEEQVFVNKNAEVKILPLDKQIDLRIELRSLNEPSTIPVDIQSNFLTYDEINLLRTARAGLVSALPSTEEIDSGEISEDDFLSGPIREPSPRNVDLEGILYVSEKDWTIWLNGKEVKPNAIPKAVLDLKVYKEYIEVEWFDSQTNQIFPIRIRPNQTFNLDSRLFLPG